MLSVGQKEAKMSRGRQKIIHSKKKKQKRDGYTPPNNGRQYDSHGRPNPRTDEQRYWEEYARSLLRAKVRPYSLKMFAQGIQARGGTNLTKTLAEYEDDIKKILFFSNPKNLNKMRAYASAALEQTFGADATTYYGVSGSMHVKDVPRDRHSHSPEKYVFPYSDEYREALLRATKVPITPWITEEGENKMCTVRTRKFLLKVDGEVLLGELSVETNKAFNSIKKFAKSDIRFSIYYRGLDEGMFIVERWDYEPLSKHLNKLDENGVFSIDGFSCPHTEYSHIHKYTLAQRLFLTQNQSPDVCPTPINAGRKPNQPEKHYEKYEDMVADFQNTYSFADVMLPEYELEKCSLKKLGRLYCPDMSSQTYWETAAERPLPDYQPPEGDIALVGPVDLRKTKREREAEEAAARKSQTVDTFSPADAPYILHPSEYPLMVIGETTILNGERVFIVKPLTQQQTATEAQTQVVEAPKTNTEEKPQTQTEIHEDVQGK